MESLKGNAILLLVAMRVNEIARRVRRMEKTMATRDELDAAIDEVMDAVTKEADEVKAVIASLEKKIADLGVPADFAPELEKLKGVKDGLDQIVNPTDFGL